MTINQLIINYMPLAESLAKKKDRLTPKNVYFDDLKSAAYFGLVKAAHRFRVEDEVAFGYYAKRLIVGEMCECLRASSHSVDLHPSLETVPDKSNNAIFADITANLSERDKEIVSLYYLGRYTLKEIGNRLSITEGRVSQLIKDCKTSMMESYR